MACIEQCENIIIFATLVGVLSGMLGGYIVWGGKDDSDPA
jgi:hypothetical protein